MQAVLDRMTPAFVYDPTLRFWAPLRQLDSASFADRSAYGHLCTRTGAVWQQQGTYFDGTDDNLNCGASAAFNVSRITIMAWFKCATIGRNNWICSREANVSPNQNWSILVYSDNIFYFNNWIGTVLGQPSSTTSIAANRWYHGVGVYDGANAMVYINGLQEDAHAQTGNLDTSSLNVRVGSRDVPDRFFNGQIDDVRIYSRGLTPAEVQNIYLETRGQYA